MVATTLVIKCAGSGVPISNPTQIILPSTLGTGLTGHFYLNTSTSVAAVNLAPGATQAAACVGSPTIGAGYLSTIGFTGYFNTGVMETADLTAILAVQTNDAETGSTTDHIYWMTNEGLDAGQGSGAAGILIETVGTSTPTSTSVLTHAWYGSSWAAKGIVAPSLTANNDSTWHVLAMTVSSASPYTVKIRNLTTGTSGSSNAGSATRQMNTVLPFWLGHGSLGGTNAGTMNVASATFWNRALSDSECALHRTTVIAPYLLAKWNIVV